jgi:hypothetical protein
LKIPASAGIFMRQVGAVRMAATPIQVGTAEEELHAYQHQLHELVVKFHPSDTHPAYHCLSLWRDRINAIGGAELPGKWSWTPG